MIKARHIHGVILQLTTVIDHAQLNRNFTQCTADEEDVITGWDGPAIIRLCQRVDSTVRGIQQEGTPAAS